MDHITNVPIAIILFYLFASDTYTNDLISKQLRNFLDKNRYAHHIIGILFMVYVYTLVSKIDNIKEIIAYAFFTYVLFVLTTKLDLQWNIMLIIVMIIGFLYNYQFENKLKEKMADVSLDSEDIQRMKKEHRKKMLYVLIGMTVITVIGVSLYSNKQKIQYGGGFSIDRFFLF